jgi:hypothetical protein
MNNHIRKFSLFASLLIHGSIAIAQFKIDTGNFKNPNTVVDSCPQKDIFDIFWKKLNSRPRADTRLDIIGLPYIGYTPATGFLFGIGGTISRRMGNPQSTNLSDAKIDASVSTHNQLMFQIKSNIFTSQNKWFFQ